MEDQRPKTWEHINEVHKLINKVIMELQDRAVKHDQSKLETPERQIFDEYTPKLRNVEYDSVEYKDCLKEMKVALNHHYTNNRHHPEYFKNTYIDNKWDPLSGMNLIDIIEMFCDWKAATLRHEDGDIELSIDINKKKFNVSNQLTNIFQNTVDLL